MLYIVICFVLLYGARGRRHLIYINTLATAEGKLGVVWNCVCVVPFRSTTGARCLSIANTTMAQSTCVLKAFHPPPLANGNQQP